MLTCTACRCTFGSVIDQKKHFGLDWHRYNLKRKVVGLGPVTEDQFNVRKQTALDATRASETTPFAATCLSCKKSFSNRNMLEQHKKSKKHIQAVKQNGGEERIEETDAEEKPAKETKEQAEYDDEVARSKVSLDLEDCIFCSHRADTLDASLIHMHKEHGFFLPDLEFAHDLEGLITYIAEKVKLGYLCLYCNGKGKAFSSHYDCQKHMVAKSHCKLLYQPEEDFDEYAPFYDFSAALDEDWETEDEEDDVESVEEDVEEEGMQISETGELILPDGRCVGKRQYRRYYRQNLRQPDSRPAILASTKEKLLLAYSGSQAIVDASMFEHFRKRRNNLVGFHSIKESRNARNLREKHRNRLDFRSHKQHNPNRKLMITV